MSQARVVEECRTCYGEGEVNTDAGPYLCPDCKGNGRVLPGSETIEERIRAIEIDQQKNELVARPEIRWLVFELRRARKALAKVRSYCDEADDGGLDAQALSAKLRAIADDVVGLTHPTRPKELLPDEG